MLYIVMVGCWWEEVKIIFSGGFIVDIDHYYQYIDINSGAHRHQKFTLQACWQTVSTSS